ncbi:peptidoglycan-binding protein [Kitasatospora paranensis]|uniref:Peptidoglycan-binding protein n=1 Tax=Kitasatospora paranensis TaxID=258053 RepID=A0ABW2FWG8_9ACTN
MRLKGPRLRTAVRALAVALGTGLLAVATTNSAYAAGTVPQRLNLNLPSCPSVVKQGENDGCVTELQTLLNQRGAALTVDGDFGAATLAAVKAFQTAKGLGADGQVGSLTRAALYYVDPAVPIDLGALTCPVDLHAGENDGCVTELQNLLNQHGAALTVNHTFDTATTTAVTAYQTSASLPATGVVDPATKAKLYGRPAPQTPPDLGTGRYSAVVTMAQASLDSNIPYVWAGGHEDQDFGPSIGSCENYGGDIQPCPADHTVGLDCSGFTRWLYWRAGAGDIGSTTKDQIVNPRLQTVSLANAVPGDLVFFGTLPITPHHVGVYTGTVNGVPMMIDEPYTGTYVRYEPVSSASGLMGYYHVG